MSSACSYFAVVSSLVLTSSTLSADDKERMLFTFDKPETARQWQTVNNGVMGGLSDGRVKVNDEKHMEFYGTLSLENNGGFASVRSRGAKLALTKGELIVARVRGDGREYSLDRISKTVATVARRWAKSERPTLWRA